MLTEVVTATNALEGFATHVSAMWAPGPFNTLNGQWNIIPLSRDDLASRSRNLAERLKALPDDKIDTELMRKIRNLPEQISWFQANTLPQLPSGNLPQVVTNFDIIISNVEQGLPPVTATSDWEQIAKSDLLPRDLARRIRNLESSIKQLTPRASELEGQVKRINDAHAAASDLPTDLLTLKEARDEVAKYREAAKISAESAASLEVQIEKSNKYIGDQEEVARQMIAKIDQAYSAATTAGLAGAFMERARQLSVSTWIWVCFLVVALAAGAVLGYLRLQSLQDLLARPNASARWIWLDASMSVLTIAGPIWFAWLSTRQIGQRFRLAEDYGFKASVARAYEGYRKEAARLDPKLEARLFASALDRLEEAPLRFLATEEHGSPYEALLASAGFQRALEKIPSLRETLSDLIGRLNSDPTKLGIDASKTKASE